MTFNQIVFDLLMLHGGGQASTDSPISEGQVRFWVNRQRASYIEKKLSASINRLVDPTWYQPLPYLALTQVDRNASDIPVENECMIHRVTVPIPINVKGSYLFALKWQNRLSSVPMVTLDRVHDFQHSRTSSMQSWGFLSPRGDMSDDMDLYVVSPMNQDEETLFMSAHVVALSPEKVTTQINQSGTVVTRAYDLDNDAYPLNGSEINTCIQQVAFQDMHLTRQALIDYISNLSDSDEAQKILRQISIGSSPYTGLSRGVNQKRSGGDGAGGRTAG